MKKCSKLISLLLAVCMVLSMLPTFAAAENTPVEDVADVSVISEADSVQTAEPIEAAPTEQVGAAPEAVLQDEDAAQVEAGNFVKTVDPSGAVMYYNSLQSAVAVASAWTSTGGTMYLLTDYTVVTSENNATPYMNYAANNTYETTEDGITVRGFWFDLGGHTLTARIAQTLIGRGATASVNIRNGRIIYQNNGRTSSFVGAVCFGYSSQSPVDGSTVLTARATLKDVDIISLKHSASTYVGRCVYSTFWNNEVRVYNSRLISEETNAVTFCKSNATPSGSGLSAIQSYGATSTLNVYGDSVVGSLASKAAVLYTKTGSGTTEGITHTCNVTAELDSKFLGSTIYTNDSGLTVASDIPSMEPTTYEFTLPDETTIAGETTVGAKPTDGASAEYPAYRYPEFKTDEELIAEGRFVKTISPDGITVGYNDLQAAYSVANAWTKPGGKLVLLQDYTLAYSTTSASTGVFAAPTATYDNNEEANIPTLGFWIDLGGHTLTATAGRPLFYSSYNAHVNIKNGTLIFRNSGRSGIYFGTMTFGVSSSTPLSSSTVYRPVVNLKDVDFYTLHWANSTGQDSKVASAICCTLWSAEVNLYDSLMISEDAQAVEFYKSSKVPTAAEKEKLNAQGVSYDVNVHGKSVIGTLSDNVSGAITLSDVASADSGVSFQLNITLSETTKVLGKALNGGSLKSHVTAKCVTEGGETLNMGEATYDLTLPDGATIATTSTIGAVPENNATATVAALVHTPLVENNVASFISSDGTEGAVTTLGEAFEAWKNAGYHGTIKLHDNPQKDDFTGASRVVGGNVTYSTTSSSGTTKLADILIGSAADGGDLTLDLNGFTAATPDIFLATAKNLNGFTLTIQNGKLASSAAAVLLLDGKQVGVTLDGVELEITEGDGYCVYDYRADHSYMILRGCKATAATRGALFILTNAANKADSSLLYYVKDCDLEYKNTSTAARPFAVGTNASGAYRDYTVVFDGDNTFVTTYKASDGVPYVNGSNTQTDWSCFLGGELVKPDGSTPAPWTVTTDTSKTLLTTEDAAEATVTVADMTFCFKTTADAIRYAAVFGRCFEGTTVVLKQDTTVAAAEAIGNAKFATSFTVDLGGHTLTGNGTDPIFTLAGDADVTLKDGTVRNGEVSPLNGAKTFTYENCSVNSDLVYVRVSNKSFDGATTTYTTAGESATLYFASAADAIVFSQTDSEATADKGGQIKLLADSAVKDGFSFDGDETCAIRLNKTAKAIDFDLNGYTFQFPGAICIGGDEAFAQKLSVNVKNGTWEQTKPGASAFRIEGTEPLFNVELSGVTLISAGAGVSYFAAGDSAENLLVIADGTVVARKNGVETLNGEMTGRIGGRIIIADTEIAAVNKDNGWAIVDGVAAAGDPSHILLVGKAIALYSAKSGNKPVKISEAEGDICVAPDYKVILEEPQALTFSDEKVKEENYVVATLAGKEYEALTRWTPNTLASYYNNGTLSFFSSVADLEAAYAADETGGGVLTLLADVTFPGTFIVDKDLTIELDGFRFDVSAADAILVEAGKTLTVSNGTVSSGKTAIVNKGTLTLNDVELIGANALQISGDAAATATVTAGRLNALGADGFALKANGAEGSNVTLDDTVLAAPYAVAPLQIADGNTVEFLTEPEIYAKQGNEAVGFTVAENGSLVVPGDLAVAALLRKTSLDIDGTTYTVSSFGFASINVSFVQDGTTLHTTTIYSGTAPDYNVKPEKISMNNVTYLFIGWKIAGDETLYQIGELPVLFEDTVFTATFEETNHIATIDLNGDISFYDDMDSAFNALQNGAILTLWKSLELDEPIDIFKDNFTFDLGGFTINATEAPYAIALYADNVTVQNGKIISTGEAFTVSGSAGGVLQDLKIYSASTAILADGGSAQINNTLAVSGYEALYAQNGTKIESYGSEFYSTDGYALTAKGAGTSVAFTGSNKLGSVKNGQPVMKIAEGASVDTVTDTFYVTQGLRDSGKWYECDAQSNFALQSTSIERTATNTQVTNEATGYKETAEFYAVNSETAAATVNGVAYNTLASALSAAGKLDGATVVLLRDINTADEKRFSYSFSKDMTVDLNGFTLVGRESYATTTTTTFLGFSSGRNVTFKNGNIIAPNSSTSSKGSNVYNIFAPSGGMTLRFENVNLFTKNAGIYASTAQKEFHLELVGGVFVNYGSNYPIHFNFTGEDRDASLKISGGTILIASSDRAVVNQKSTTKDLMNIEDCYTYSKAAKPIPNPAEMDDAVFPEPTELNATANPRAWLNEQFANLLAKYGSILNFSAVSDSAKLMHYVSSEGIAEVDGKTYGSVTDALAAAATAEDPTVKLTQDTTEYGLSTIPANATLDLDGKTLSFDGNADMTVLGEIKLNGGKLVSNGNVLFKAGSKDLSGEIVAQDYRLDQRLMPDKISMTLDSGVTVNFKMNATGLSLGDVRMNGETVEITETRTQTIFSRTFDFDSFNAVIELTAIDSNGALHRSGYKTGIKTFADGVANDDTASAAFKTAMNALSVFGGSLDAGHDWVKVKDFTNIAGCSVYVDPSRAFELRFTGTVGDKLTVTYTDSTGGSQVKKELTIADTGDVIYNGLYTACLSDTITITGGGASETVKYADLVKDAIGETPLYTNMIAYSNAANALFKS